MTNIISRYNIHPDLTFYQNRQDSDGFHMFGHADMTAAIRQWKNILTQTAGIRPGHKIGIGSSLCDLRYLSLLYATTELGAILLVLDKPSTLTESSSCRCRVLAPFDLYLAWDESDPITKAMGQWFARQQLPFSMWDVYATSDHSAEDLMAAQPNDVVMMAPTSGSTGDPKVVQYRHNWFSAVGERCRVLFDYNQNDRVLHLTNLHHGGSAGCFFFPTFNHCRHHYFEYGLDQAPGTIDRIVNLVMQERITKIMFPNNRVLEQFIHACPRVDHELKLFCLQANSPAWIEHIHRANIHSVISFFGSAETLGPLFVNVIDQQSTHDHNVLNYGLPLDDFYNITIEDQRLKTVDQFGNQNMLNDCFELDRNGNFVFQRRVDLVRVNEVIMAWSQLDDLVSRHFAVNQAWLIADSVTNKIYLLCDHSLAWHPDYQQQIDAVAHDLAKIDPILVINYVDLCPVDQFFNNIKIDRNAICSHFRVKYKLT